MADGSMKTKRDALLVECAVAMKYFPSRENMLDTPDDLAVKTLDKRFQLGRIQMQTFEQVCCDY